MEDKLKELVTKRSNVKGRITRFKNYLEDLKDLSEFEVKKLELKLSKFELMFTEFDELQKEIEYLNEGSQDVELKARALIEEDFFNCIVNTQDLIKKFKREDKMSRSNSLQSMHSQCPTAIHNNCDDNLGFRLPIIKISNFDGAYFKWMEFKETFTALIHENNKIRDIHKFYYLNSYLEGDAARVLTNLEVTDRNYTEAWQLLCERYDNKRQLINNHLKSLFNLEPIRDSEKALRYGIDHITKNLRALSSLGLPTDKWDVLIVYLVAAKLETNTYFKWEEHRNTLPDIITLDDFFKFLKNRADVLEAFHKSKSDRPTNAKPTFKFPPNPAQQRQQSKALLTTSTNESKPNPIECIVCKDSHRIYDCSTFKSKSMDDRKIFVSNFKLCSNCLRAGHPTSRCRLPGSCKYCRKRHNTLLHTEEESDKGPSKGEAIAMTAYSCPEVLLCTAEVILSNPDTNESMTVRAVLDCGSQSSFVTEAIKSKLKLSYQPSDINVVGIGDSFFKQSTERCSLRLFSKNTTGFSVTMSCLVLPKICGNVPKYPFNISHFNFSGFNLADPKFNEPASIDLLIGADLFWDLIGSEQHSLGDKQPILRSSKLGWLVAGPMLINYPQPPKVRSISCNFSQQEPNSLSDMHYFMTQFWELEKVPQKLPISEEEQLCEKHFLANTTRLDSGRFCVALPLKSNPDCLGESYYLAKKRFLNLEQRFRRQPDLKTQYSEFIKEYKALGHLSVSSIVKPSLSYYLPHHPIIREQSESTKLRVVFDASARSSSGFSVNHLQMVGPTIQDSLFNILVRYRQYRYVLNGDVEKLFRQIIMSESDRDLQLILWRDKESEPLRTLRLNTVTYGFASATFLSTRCIWQLGEECSDSKIKTIIQNDMYCDDVLTGCNTIEELLYIKQSISATLKKGCLNLRKFRSNCQQILEADSGELEKDHLLISNSTSTLGVGWYPSTDELHFPISYKSPKMLSKRTMLSSTFQIFDPLGLLAHVTIKPKILIQRLWSLNLGWDDPVPQDIKMSWLKFTDHLSTLSPLRVSRNVLINEPILVEIHCFCDASQLAYGACVYLRSMNKFGQTQVSLLCAKSRVAPIKATTIPRLELCAALLGAQLTATVTQALRCPINRHVYWTDSSIVLCWLRSSNKLKTFVANRIATILELTKESDWFHVPTELNPADLASRGLDPQHVGNCTLWWNGPPYLLKGEDNWPAPICIQVEEEKTFPVLVAQASPITIGDEGFNAGKYSSFTKAQRVLATIFRFYSNLRNPNQRLFGPLTVSELESSLTILIKNMQNDFFYKEISLLKLNKTLSSKGSLLSLNPFLDSNDILRVGGRIEASTLYSYDKKHPILINAKHHLARLLFELEHKRLLHAGPQLILASIRERYWTIGGRNLARRVARECLKCRRLKGSTLSNIMGNLPPDRIEPDFPFITVGTDFAGPFLITDRKGRGCKITKCYLCIFVCFRYKCIHLEVVSDLSKDAFILTLNRFIARRGIPKVIYCDNGRNFVAAAKEIRDFFKDNEGAFIDFAARRGIEFHFSPAYAPHFGGLWEAGVKSAKFHLHRVLKDTHLTFEELASLFAQIESILNSRPLCPLSPSPNDFMSLTPGHFLIGRALMAIPTAPLLDQNTSRLDRFRRLEQIRQHFWKRWANEYVAELQQRTKWRTKCKDLQLNDLVVIKEDGAPPMSWRLGRVNKLFPGSDGVPRVAEVSTTRGLVRRAITRLCLLPMPSQDNT